jgi:hypothetical protein
MEVKLKKVTREVMTYVATDGREFDTEDACLSYEESLHARELIKTRDFYLGELDDLVPLVNDEFPSSSSEFKWYKLENEKDFNLLNHAYFNRLRRPSSFPDIICVEMLDADYCADNIYSFLLSDCKVVSETFWNSLGYNIKIEKKE